MQKNYGIPSRRAMTDSLDKKYYKIGEVSLIVDIPVPTLRYWESRFSFLKPKRNEKGTRRYTPADIERIRMVNYLVKERGLHIDAAARAVKENPTGILNRYRAIERLRDIRSCLVEMLDAVSSIRSH